MARLSAETTIAAFRRRDSRMPDPENLSQAETERDPVIFRVGVDAVRRRLAERRKASLVQTELGRLSVPN